MPKRSFTIISLRVHKRGTSRKDPSNDLDVDKLPGDRDLLTMFERCCRDVMAKPDQLDDESAHISTGVLGITVSGRRLFVDSNIGEYDDGQDLRHRRTGAVTYARQPDDVAPVASRAVLLVPVAGKVALYFAEVSGHSSAGTRLLTYFGRYFNQVLGEDHTLIQEYVAEEEEWIKAAQLSAVTAVRYGWSTNTEDASIPSSGGTLTATLREPTGYLPRALFERLQDKQGRGRLLGWDFEPDSVLVTMEGAGRTKKFDLSEFKTPRLLIPLTGAGVPPLPESVLLEKALSEAKSIFPRFGVKWNTGWNQTPSA